MSTTAGPVGAIVLSGGRARRYGGAAKPAAEIGARSLLRRVIDVLADVPVGDMPIVVVGPTDGLPDSYASRVVVTREDPPYAGPVAATAAGLARLPDVTQVLLLAADMPFLDPAALARLRDALDDAPAAVLASGGRQHWLAAAWRRTALTEALQRRGELENSSMRAIYADIPVAEVNCDARTTFDVDTPEDLQRAKEWT